jgi:hypothetical protein
LGQVGDAQGLQPLPDSFCRTELHQNLAFHISEARHTSSGWQGTPPPLKDRKTIRSRWKTHLIKHDVAKFLPIPYEVTDV